MSSSQATFNSILADVQGSIAGSSFTFHKDLKKQTESLGVVCGDSGYPFGLEWLSIDRDKRSCQTTIVCTESEGDCDKRVGIRSPNWFRCAPGRSRLHVQECTDDLSSSIQRGNANYLVLVQVLTWKQTAALSSATHAYHSATTAQISTLRQVTECLIEAGTREDKPTGNTPRKKMRQYQDEWELTKSREVVLKEWRKRGVSAKDRGTVLVEHVPLRDGGGGEVATSDDDAVMGEADGAEEVEEDVLAQSVASTLSSSSTAASVTIRQKCLSPPPIPAPPIPAPALKPIHKRDGSKSGLPTLGTLTERPTNVFGGRRRHR